MEPLLMESVWLKQSIFEDAECHYHMKLAGCLPGEHHDDTQNVDLQDPLLLESINFQQREYEEAESMYQQRLAGTLPNVKFTTLTTLTSLKTPEKKTNTAFPVNYADKMDTVLKELSDKRRAWKKTYDAFQKVKDKKISGMRETLQKLQDAVTEVSEHMEKEIAVYKKHEEQGILFLRCLASTMNSVKDLKQGIKAKKTTQQEFGFKSIHGMLNYVNMQLDSMYTAGLIPNLKEGDVTRNVRKQVSSISLFEIPKGLRKNIGKYPNIIGQLQEVEHKVNMQKLRVLNTYGAKLPQKNLAALAIKSPCLTNTEVYSMEAGSMEAVGSPLESLDGSLGEECLSDSWVSISELDINELKAEDSGYGARGGGDGPASAKESLDSKQLSSSEKKKISQSKAAQNVQQARKKAVVVKKETVQPRDFDEAETLGRSGDAQDDLIACFASLQAGNGKGGAISKSKPESSNSKVKSAQQSSKINLAGGNMKIPPLMSVPNSSKSGASNTPSPPKSTSPAKAGKGKKVSPKKISPPTPRLRTKAEDVLNQQDLLLQRSRYERQLNEMSHQMKQMLLVCGPTIQLQEMLSEAELLLQMIFNNFDEDIFRHRLALLQMAFNYHLQEDPKFKKAGGNPAAAVLPSKGLTFVPQVEPTQERGKKKGGKASTSKPVTRNVSASSRVTKIATVNPCGATDRHRAGISSIVVLDEINRLVLVDIINGCLKLFAIDNIHNTGSATLLQSQDLPQPYYMTKFAKNQIIVSRGNKLLSVYKVSYAGGLALNVHISCSAQYYGLGWINRDIVACANYDGNSIDLMKVAGKKLARISSFNTHSHGPELLSVIPATYDIVFLERVLGKSMHLTCIDSNTGDRMFSVSLGGGESDVWNVSAVGDKIICCSKQSSKVILVSAAPHSSGSNRVMVKSTLGMPSGMVKMPFAMCFSDKDKEMYIANDAAWEEDRNHYVTTQVNIFGFYDR